MKIRTAFLPTALAVLIATGTLGVFWAKDAKKPVLNRCTKEPQVMQVEKTTEWSGQYDGPHEPIQRVAKTEAEWRSLWQLTGNEPPVKLDPEKEMGVGIFLGERFTGGYGVDVRSITEEDGNAVVEYEEYKPSSDMIVTQALTYPYKIQIFPKTDKNVIFRKVEAPPLDDMPADPVPQ
jgi:hypothetical protein